MPTGNKTARSTRLRYLDTVQMWDGLHAELSSIVKSSIEPAIRERVKSKNVLTLKSTHGRSSMAHIFNVVQMPFGLSSEDSLGTYLLRDNSTVQGILIVLNNEKLNQDAVSGWANSEYDYLCDCISLMKHIQRLIEIGEETQMRVVNHSVFCSYCFRYAESRAVGRRKNLKLCEVCREVDGDGWAYKQAKRMVERYAKINDIPSMSVWMWLKKDQDKGMNDKIRQLRHQASTEGLSSESRFSVIIELIENMPRLNKALRNDGLVVQTFDELLREILQRMDFRYKGITDYFRAHPEYLSATLMHYDRYLLMDQSIRGEATKKVDKIRDLLSAGKSVASIVKETKFSKASVYNLIKENRLVVRKST